MKEIDKIKKYTVKLSNDLILVRHAEAVKNNNISNNLLPLTELGVEQAKTVAKLLKNQFDIVFCSTSKRAIMTAEIIACDKKPIQDMRLLERGWGNVNQDGKESDEEAKIRITKFLKEILEKYDNKRILIVTHGALMKIFQELIEEKSSKRELLNNCATIKYTKNKEKLILRNW